MQNNTPLGDLSPIQSKLKLAIAAKQAKTNTMLDMAVTVNPDRRAEAMSLSTTTNLPVNVVENDIDYARMTNLQKKLAVTLGNSSSPELKKWMSVPENAALTHDEAGLWSEIADGARSYGAGIVGLGQAFSGIAALNTAATNKLLSLFPDDVEKKLWEWDAQATSTLPDVVREHMLPNAAFRGVGDTFRAGADFIRPEDQGYFDQVFEGLGQMTGQVALAILSGGSSSMVTMAGQGADQMEQQAISEGATQDDIDNAVIMAATVTAATEKIGLDKLLDRVPPAFKNKIVRKITDIFVGGVFEGGQEALESVLYDVVEKVTFDEDQAIGGQAMDEGAVAFSVGAIMRGILGGNSRLRTVEKAENAEAHAEKIRELFAALENAELFKRSDAKGRELFQSIMDGSNQGEISINASGFVSSITQGDEAVDVYSVAADLGIDKETLDTAVSTGNDITVKAGALASVVRGNEGLVNTVLMNVRAEEDALTVTEADEAMVDAQAAINEEIKFAQEEDTQEQIDYRPADAVYESVLNQLNQIGRNNINVNKQYAEAHRGFAKAMQALFAKEGEEFNIAHFYQQEGFNVEDETQFTERKNRDIALDIQLNNIRKGKKDTSIKDLFTYMKEHGQVKSGGSLAGELNAMGINPKTNRGLFSNMGEFGDADNIVAEEFNKEFDLVAQEVNGYVDRDWLLQKISDGSLNEGLQTSEEQTAALLDEMGIDLNESTNQEIIDALIEGSDVRDLGNVLKQTDTTTEAFKNWFGDSKVVDEDGDPLVVYHGTKMEIDAFDKGEIGSNFNADEFGFFFTNNPNEASQYALNDTIGLKTDLPDAQVIPAYVSMKNPLIVDRKYLESLFGKDTPGIENEGVISYWDNNQTWIMEEYNKGDYDGIIIEDADSDVGFAGGVSGLPDRVYVVPEPTQIKSIHNRGTFDPNDARILFQDNRGSYSPDLNTIFFNEKSDKTTFLHESGHFFFEMIDRMAKMNDAPDAITSMRDEMFELSGYDPAKTFKENVPAMEHFAESFEAYLETGKAPSAALKKAFQQFKNWFMEVYRNLSGSLPELTPDLQNFFDRMMATEEEINQAEAESGLTISPDLAAVIDEADQQTIMDIAHDAHDTAVEQQYRERLKHERRVTKSWWQKELNEAKALAKIDLLNTRAYRTRHFLRTGEFPIGETPSDMKDMKISTIELHRIFGDGISGTLKYLVNSHTKRKGANVVGPDEMGILLGYSSFNEMYEDTVGIQGIDDAANRLANDRMKERYGDPLNDGSMEENAMNHVAGNQRASFIEAQVKSLAKKSQKGRPTPLKLIRATIEQNMEGKQLSEVLFPRKFLHASIRAGKRADKAIASGDLDLAFTEKQRQLVNYEMFRHATFMKDRVQIMDKRLKRRGKKSIDPSYINPKLIEAIKSLLPAYGYGVSVNEQDITTGLERTAEIIKEHNEAALENVEAGIVLDILPWVLDGSQAKPMKELTFDQLKEIDQSVTKLWNVGRGESQLSKVELAKKRATYAEEIRANNPTRDAYDSRIEKNKYDKGDDSDVTVAASNLGVMLQRMPHVLKFLSKDLHRDIMGRFDSAAATEQELTARVIEGLRTALKKYSILERTTMDSNRLGLIYIDELGESWTKENILSLAMQWGTQSNRDTVINGDPRLSVEIVESILNKHIDKRDLKFIQEVFDVTESLWPEVAELEKADKGVVPEKLEATPIELKAGTIPGGYMRLKYTKSKADSAGVAHNEISTNKGAFSAATASTKNGSIIERVAHHGFEVRLDFGVVFEHLQETITDVSYRHAVRYASNILIKGDVATAIAETMGQDYNDMIRQTIKNVARNDFSNEGWAGNFFRALRINNAIAIMSGNLKSAISAPSGIFQGFVEVGKVPMMKSMAAFSNPLNAAKIIKMINEKSPIMSYRSKIVNRDLRQIRKKFGKDILKSQATDIGFYPIGKLDKYISSIVWYAAYSKSLAEGNTDKNAITDANQSVSLSQSSGNIFDISPAESGPELYRILTFLYNYMGSTYNLTRGIIRKTGRDYKNADGVGKARIIGKAAVDLSLLHIAQMIVYEMMVGNMPEDDDDKEEFFMWGFANQLFGMIPLLSSAVRVAEFNISPSTLPADSMLRNGDRLIRGAVKDIEDGEISRNTMRSGAMLVGAYKGIPFTFELLKIEKGLHALSEGEDVSAWEIFVSGVEKDK